MGIFYSTYAPHTHSTSNRSWLVSGLLFPACAFYLLNPSLLALLDTTSLLMYETGRTLFGLIGGTTVLVGGTIGQLALPGFLVGYFFLHRYNFALQVFLFWLGQNLINVCFQILKPSFIFTSLHGRSDWDQLLSALDLSWAAPYIAAFVFATGSLCFLFSLLIPGFMKD